MRWKLPWRKNDRGNAILLKILYLLMAFNTINQTIFWGALFHCSVWGTVLQWLHSFLQTGPRRGCASPWPLAYGVSQGLVLSPMLFNIHMKLPQKVIRKRGLWFHQYVEDTLGSISHNLRTFYIVAHQLWNLLLNEACVAPLLCSFRRYVEVRYTDGLFNINPLCNLSCTLPV